MWRESEHGGLEAIDRPSLYNLLKRDNIQEQLAGGHALG